MKILYLIIHCSDGHWGEVSYLNRVGLERGFRKVSYQKIICNAFPSYLSWKFKKPVEVYDGKIQQGRADDEIGAHCVGYNSISIGICLVGKLDEYPPTARQWEALVDACVRLCQRHSIPVNNILGHRETPSGAAGHKTCPGGKVDMTKLRAEVAARLA